MLVLRLKYSRNIWINMERDRSQGIRMRSKVAAALAITVTILGISSYAIREARKPAPIVDYAPNERGGETTIVIPNGASGDQIALILFNAGVVKSSRAFFAAATENEKSKGIQPGTYAIETRIPGSEAVTQLLERKRRLMVLLIREGERSYEISEELLRLDFSTTEIKRIFNQSIEVPGFGKRDAEGFLFPATYNLLPGEGIDSVKNRLLEKFRSVAQEVDLESRAESLGFSPYQILILASIVQAEGFSESDFKRIAQVIYNRLEIGMPLQMDSTILYALKERRIAVSSKDLQLSSEYNTYRRKGLPPTPIGNPGKAAIEATLNPEVGDWLYFVTTEPTITKFTKSYDEFLKFKREFKANLRAGRFDGEQ